MKKKLMKKKPAKPDTDQVIAEKIHDAQTPGFEAEFTPDEAEQAGAFPEEALSEQDAAESAIDLLDQEQDDGK